VTEADLPDELKSFLLQYIDSASLLEVLLLMQQHPDREWTAAEVLKELRSSEHSVAQQLEGLHRRKLIRKSGDPAEKQTYRYFPTPAELAKTIDLLAKSRNTFSARIIHFIYNKSIEQIREFSEAFRIRKGGENYDR
jgi:hypothetical protein